MILLKYAVTNNTVNHQGNYAKVSSDTHLLGASHISSKPKAYITSVYDCEHCSAFIDTMLVSFDSVRRCSDGLASRDNILSFENEVLNQKRGPNK